MIPLIKFQENGYAKCPFPECDVYLNCISDLKRHFERNHSCNGQYHYEIDDSRTSRGNYLFSVWGKCGCGCGREIRYPKIYSRYRHIPSGYRYMPGHSPPFYKAGHNRFLGGIRHHSCGQIYVSTEEYDSNARPIYVARSRLVMENRIGRSLDRDEVVFHKDGDNTNDDPSNLEIITRAELVRRNRWLKLGENAMKNRHPRFCPNCGTLSIFGLCFRCTDQETLQEVMNYDGSTNELYNGPGVESPEEF